MTRDSVQPETERAPPINELLESVIAASIERLVEMRDRAPGFAALDEETLTELVGSFQDLETKAHLSLWDAQIERMRTKSEEDEESQATADDFNGPIAAEEYERFLILLACAGGRDRFRALDIRRDEGIEAAITFLEGCNVTPEADHGPRGGVE